jgi:hypothetical protein
MARAGAPLEHLMLLSGHTTTRSLLQYIGHGLEAQAPINTMLHISEATRI